MYDLEQDKVDKVMAYLEHPPIYKTVKADEGYDVITFNKEVSEKFVEPKMTKDQLSALWNFLEEKNTLNIKVGEHGYVSAALKRGRG